MGGRKGKATGGAGWSLTRPGAGPPRPASAGAARDERPTLRLRLEKRAGKSVTVVASSLVGEDALDSLLRELKSLLATGGTRRGGDVELQGDHRDRLRELLRGRGYLVKG